MDNYIEISGRTTERFKNIAKNVALQVFDLMNQPKGLEVAIEFVSENEIQSQAYRNFYTPDRVRRQPYRNGQIFRSGKHIDRSSSACRQRAGR